jgi:hypothetical protein
MGIEKEMEENGNNGPARAGTNKKRTTQVVNLI